MVVPLRIKFQQCWFFKKHLLKWLWNQGILATLFTTIRTVLYFTGVFMLNGKQLLNKPDTQNFPPKCLFTLRMTNFYKCLNEYDVTFTEIFMITIKCWHELKNSQYGKDILHWIQRVTLPTFLPQCDSSMNLGSRNKGFLMVPNFPWDNYLY